MNFNFIKKCTPLVLSVSITASLLTGCGGGKDESGSETVRIATMTTGFALAIHTANTTNLYSDMGLTTDEQFFDNGPSINEAIASGDIDVATIGSMPAVTGAIANGSRIVAWMADDEASVQIYARNDSPIVASGKGNLTDHPNIYGKADDWKGKDVICAKGTSSHYTLLSALNAFGLKESDINLINMEGSAGASAFVSGTGDIFVGFDPQWAACYLAPDEYTCIATCSDTGNKLYDVLVATDDFCNNHSDELVKIIEGMLKMQMSYADSQDEYDKAMYEWQNTYGECSEELAAYSAEIKPMRPLAEQKALFEDNNKTSEAMETIIGIADFMVDNGIIEAADKDTFVNGNYVDPTFLFQAINNINEE